MKPPKHIIAPMHGGTDPKAAQARADRIEWIARAVSSGMSEPAMARALNLRRSTLHDLIVRERRAGNLPPAPVAGDQQEVRAPSQPRGIRLHRAAWEVEVGHDPRHETMPRLPPIRSPRRRVSVKSVIDAIRAEVHA